MLCWKNKDNQIPLFTNKTKRHRVRSAVPPISSLGPSVTLQAPNADDQSTSYPAHLTQVNTTNPWCWCTTSYPSMPMPFHDNQWWLWQEYKPTPKLRHSELQLELPSADQQIQNFTSFPHLKRIAILTGPPGNIRKWAAVAIPLFLKLDGEIL